MVGPGSGSLLPLLLAVLLGSVVVHEAGHVTGARLAGFRITRWRIGPLAAVRVDGRWRLRLTADGLGGGMVLADPVTPERLARRHALLIACGPAAHLGLAAVLLALAAVGGGPTALALAAVVGVSGLLNLLPWEFRGSGRWSDGLWLLCWLLRPERAARRVAVSALPLAHERGERPRDWDERWVRLAIGGPAVPAGRVEVAGSLLAYGWSLDRGDVARAGELLDRAVAGLRRLEWRRRALVTIEAAFFAARFRGDVAGAEELIAESARAPRLAFAADLHRALAAVHLAAGRRAEALDSCDRALAALPFSDGMRTGLSALDRDLIESIRTEAGSPPTPGAGAHHPPGAGQPTRQPRNH